jgi:2-dehydro-3-deoxy-D-gluconate 5-dehydrogenase
MYSLFGPAGIPTTPPPRPESSDSHARSPSSSPYTESKVNAILPDWFETALTADARRNERGERIRRKTPAERWGELDDLAGAATFVSTPASDFFTGVALSIDGGYAIADQRLPG